MKNIIILVIIMTRAVSMVMVMALIVVAYSFSDVSPREPADLAGLLLFSFHPSILLLVHIEDDVIDSQRQVVGFFRIHRVHDDERLPVVCQTKI